MSRHTPAKGSLTRSFGNEDGEELVVELDAAGFVVFRREPLFRRLKRGEKLPELRLKVADIMEDLSKPQADIGDTEDVLEKLLKKLPIAKFEGDSPEKIAYSMKVWMMKALKEHIEADRQ
jgi:hypothetical protein